MIRAAAEEDFQAIQDVVTAAFGGQDEAELVARLRAERAILYELVEMEAQVLRGHVLLSAMTGDIPGLAALAPVSVAPPWQNAGVGDRLIRTAIDQARTDGLRAILVLGRPRYYARFGFNAAAASALSAPFQGSPAFMGLELCEGALAQGGAVHYAAAFGV